MAVDIRTLFNETLPGALARNAEDARTINAKFQLNITDEGEWFIDVTETGPSCVPGNPGSADCILTVGSDDFQKLHADPQNQGMSLYFEQKLKVEGNVMLAMKLAKLFAYK